MAESFTIVTFPEQSTNPHSIAFRLIRDHPVAPADRTFAVNLARDLSLLRRVGKQFIEDFEDSTDFRECYNLFFAAARSGVEHPDADLTSGRAALAEAKANALLTIGRNIRNAYIKRLSLAVTVEIVLSALIAGLLILGPIVMGFSFSTDSEVGQLLDIMRILSIAAIGNAISIWLSSIFYLQELAWEKLEYLDPSGFSPTLRITTVLVITIVLLDSAGLQSNNIGPRKYSIE